MKKRRNIAIVSVIVALLLPGMVFADEDQIRCGTMSMDGQVKLIEERQKNSEERYLLSRAFAQGVTLEEARRTNEKEIQSIPRSADEYISYRTMEGIAGFVETRGKGRLFILYASELRCIVSRQTNRVVYVEDFGNPYITTNSEFLGFDHGGFNFARYSATSARLSTTGVFYLDRSVGVGLDIISVSINGRAKSRMFTVPIFLSAQ